MDGPSLWKLSKLQPTSQLDTRVGGNPLSTLPAHFTHRLYQGATLGGRAAAQQINCGQMILSVHKRNFMLPSDPK